MSYLTLTRRRKFSFAERRKVYEKCGGRCAYCGTEIPLKDMTIDHITPIQRGGTNAHDNLLPACGSCNHYKSTLTVDDFRAQIEQWLYRLNRDSVTYRNTLRYGLIEEKPRKIAFYFEREGGE